jgi:hypothetical protein
VFKDPSECEAQKGAGVAKYWSDAEIPAVRGLSSTSRGSGVTQLGFPMSTAFVSFRGGTPLRLCCVYRPAGQSI